MFDFLDPEFKKLIIDDLLGLAKFIFVGGPLSWGIMLSVFKILKILKIGPDYQNTLSKKEKFLCFFHLMALNAAVILLLRALS